MTTAEELGFIKPTGDELVNTGDNAISNNADKSAAMFDRLSVGLWYRGELPINTNLDTWFQTGTWSVSTSAAAATITGRPGDSRFNGAFAITVELLSTANGIYKMTATVKNTGSTRSVSYVRTSLSESYLAWELSTAEVTEYIDQTKWGKGALPIGTDLNTLTTEGTRWTDTSSVTATIVNKPTWFTNDPFSVEVFRQSLSNGIYRQEATQKISGTSGVRRAYRVSLSGSYLEWVNPDSGGSRELNHAGITVLGDSQSERSATSWDVYAGAKLDGMTIFNHARSGDQSDTVLIREGIIPFICQVAGGSIPASGSVTLTTPMRMKERENRMLIGGTINGIAGSLTHVANDEWTFARSTAGTAVSVPGWTEFKSSWGDGGNAQTAGHVLICWFGGNDFTYSNSGQERSIADHVIGNYRRFIDYALVRGYRPVIAGTTNRLASGAGTDGFAQVQRINSELRRMFPDIFLDVQEYYVQRAIYDAGLTPTQADLDAIGRGEIPPQLFLADGVHLIPEAHQAIGEYWIAPWLAAKGYARTTIAQNPLPILTV